MSPLTQVLFEAVVWLQFTELQLFHYITTQIDFEWINSLLT